MVGSFDHIYNTSETFNIAARDTLTIDARGIANDGSSSGTGVLNILSGTGGINFPIEDDGMITFSTHQGRRIEITDVGYLRFASDVAGNEPGIVGAHSITSRYLFAEYLGTLEGNDLEISPNGSGEVVFKATGGEAGRFKLNSENNTKSVTIKGPATISSNYTLTLPNTDGNVNELLKTDGAGNLSWINQSLTVEGGDNGNIYAGYNTDASGTKNIYIGNNCGSSGGTIHEGNIGIGTNSLGNIAAVNGVVSDNNTVVGNRSGEYMTCGSGNTLLGAVSSLWMTTGT